MALFKTSVKDISAGESATIIADHYSKSVDYTFKVWEERGRAFILLLALSAMHVLMSFRDFMRLDLFLAHLYNAWLKPPDAERLNADSFSQSFPFDILQLVLLISILYLMILIYNKTAYLLQSYSYLAEIERVLRVSLLQKPPIFTRESAAYWRKRQWQQDMTKYVYIALLGFLLFAITLGYTPLAAERISLGAFLNPKYVVFKILMSVISIFVLGLIAFFYFSYASLSITGDSKDAQLSEEAKRDFGTSDGYASLEQKITELRSLLTRSRILTFLANFLVPYVLIALFILLLNTAGKINLGPVAMAWVLLFLLVSCPIYVFIYNRFRLPYRPKTDIASQTAPGVEVPPGQNPPVNTV